MKRSAEIERAILACEPPRILRWQDVILDDGGTERTWTESVRLFGQRASQVAHIRRAIELNSLRPSPIEAPPRVFLSYRHGSVERERWTVDLASTLERRGYTVVFDGASKTRVGEEIADLVARIAECHIFVAVVDNSYLESISATEGEIGTRTWAYVEWRIASTLANRTGLRKLSLVAEGDQADRGSVIARGNRAGTAFEVSAEHGRTEVLDLFFPAPEPLDSDSVRRAAELLIDSRNATLGGDHPQALTLAHQAVELLRESADTQYRLGIAALAMGNVVEALKAARKAAQLAPTRTFVRYLEIFSELQAGNVGRASSLLSQVFDLFAKSWRAIVLQLGVEVVGEAGPHAMESCARAAARLMPTLGRSVLSWRAQRLGLLADNLDPSRFTAGTAIPISGADLDGGGELIHILQVDRPIAIPGTDTQVVPSLYIRGSVGPNDYLRDLDILLLAYGGAEWFPRALRHVGWSHLDVDRASLPGHEVALLENGRLQTVRVHQGRIQ